MDIGVERIVCVYGTRAALAMLNMLDDEIAGTNNEATSNSTPHNGITRPRDNVDEQFRSSGGNSRDINRPRYEFLSWTVDQMRLDHESRSFPDIVTRQINVLSNHELVASGSADAIVENDNTDEKYNDMQLPRSSGCQTTLIVEPLEDNIDDHDISSSM